ncbi:uncharacterized protein [Magallana gigas]|uniref:uncharacterized protein n=1 Tax=Magallana gigas TaxID=29159 RepID=UPI0033420C90
MGGNWTLTCEQKKIIVKQKSLCFNCLGTHRVKDCPSERNCKKCGKRHHTYLCNGLRETTHDPTGYEKAIPSSVALHASSVANTQTIFKTATAKVTSGKTVMTTNILFDEGSQRSFITKELAENLNLKYTGTETLTIAAFGGKEMMRTLKTSTLYLIGDSGEKIQIQVVVVPGIAAKVHTYHVPIKNLPYLKHLKFAHSYDGTPFDISLLIGVDHYWDIVGNDIIRGPGPVAVSSKIGYPLSGPTHSNVKHNHVSSYNVLSYLRPEELNLEKFWKMEDLETLEKTTDLPVEDRKYVTYENGRYTAKLPWKEEVCNLPSNEIIALERTKNVICRLSQDPDMLKTYDNIIKEQEKCGFIEKVEQEGPGGQVHYIPHHLVKKDSSTTPNRIVYDCSCKLSGSLSLNDCLESHSPQLNGRRAFPKYFCGPEKDHKEEVDKNRLTDSFIRKQNFLANLHKRWKHKYLTSLRKYHRNCGNNVQTLKVGDVVQIYDTSPRVNWRLELITELAEGRNHLSRSATIRISNGRVTSRPLSKLYPLEL